MMAASFFMHPLESYGRASAYSRNPAVVISKFATAATTTFCNASRRSCLPTLNALRAGATDDYLSSLSSGNGSFSSGATCHGSLVDAAFSAVEIEEQSDATSPDNKNQHSIVLARHFLERTCPRFLASEISNDEDRLIKIGRSIDDLVTRSKTEMENEDVSKVAEELRQSLGLLTEECDILASGKVQVPKIRFGKTELEMPILSLGCMRFQQAWGASIETMDDVSPECQENLINILRYAVKLGVTHIETARGYGSSELQIGEALRMLFENGETRREDLIIQTKVPLRPTATEFREIIERSFKELQLDYVDLLSLHGLNMDEQYDLLLNNGKNGNLIDVVKEYMAKGKIKHLGFSTHARPDLIRRFIETNEFSYVNLHYHFCGSYTASGDGEGNLEIIRLLKDKDMGCFIISAYDKGGMLYMPSRKLRSLTLPDFEPIAFGSHFLWDHSRLDSSTAVHTISCGAARPSDLDQPAVAAYMRSLKTQDVSKRVDAVLRRMRSAEIAALGEDWVNSWTQGLPNFTRSSAAVQHCNIIWLYNLIHSFGMLEFCKARYRSMENNSKKWDSALSKEDNIKALAPGWGWTPGRAITPGMDYSEDFVNVPEKNKARVAEALQFVHELCSTDEAAANDTRIPQNWQSAYDMRPWTAFPERGMS
eukprot:CAMPEP_0185737582 /NCGR_PEP_ID=MMETSP1171-20130828/30739_1 /TAXON_ID=374046 /ORGANISM="Helicotheca tamensis, Strain CCMP826" /LENGTH=652 /DNA_ID=CAMNT_0028408537 /DNA_START=46 /DNA_END=2004 /DNA_ORIENTATION=+